MPRRRLRSVLATVPLTCALAAPPVIAPAALGAQPAAAAADDPWGPRTSYAQAGGSIRIFNPWTALDVSDSSSGRRVTSSGRLGLGYVEASADPGNGRVGGKASGGFYTEWATGGGRISQRLTLTNRTDDVRTQTFESYLHGTFTGQCLVAFNCGTWDRMAEMSSLLLIRHIGSSGFTRVLVNARLYDGMYGGSFATTTQEVMQTQVSQVTLQPGERLDLHVIWQISAAAFGGFTADASRTGTLYMPAVDGIALETESYFLAQQARPDWAQTTTPEPGTLPLITLGAVVTALAGRRRRHLRRPARDAQLSRAG